jgi:hypothetical protein
MPSETDALGRVEQALEFNSNIFLTYENRILQRGFLVVSIVNFKRGSI